MIGEFLPFAPFSVALLVIDAMRTRLSLIEDERALSSGEAAQLDVLERYQTGHGLADAARIKFDHICWRAPFSDLVTAEAAGVPLRRLLPEIAGAIPRGSVWRPFPYHLAGLAWIGITLISDGVRRALHTLPATNGKRAAQLSAVVELQSALTALVELRDGDARLPKRSKRAEAAFAAVAPLIDDDSITVALRALGPGWR